MKVKEVRVTLTPTPQLKSDTCCNWNYDLCVEVLGKSKVTQRVVVDEDHFESFFDCMVKQATEEIKKALSEN